MDYSARVNFSDVGTAYFQRTNLFFYLWMKEYNDLKDGYIELG